MKLKHILKVGFKVLRGHEMDPLETLTPEGRKIIFDNMKRVSDFVGAVLRLALCVTIGSILAEALRSDQYGENLSFFFGALFFGVLSILQMFRVQEVLWISFYPVFPTTDPDKAEATDIESQTVSLKGWKRLGHYLLTVLGYVYLIAVQIFILAFVISLITLGKDVIWTGMANTFADPP